MFHINSLRRAGPPRRASKSKLRTNDNICLSQYFLDNFSFHELCLFMCRIQNANIGFRVSCGNKCS